MPKFYEKIVKNLWLITWEELNKKITSRPSNLNPYLAIPSVTIWKNNNTLDEPFIGKLRIEFKA